MEKSVTRTFLGAFFGASILFKQYQNTSICSNGGVHKEIWVTWQGEDSLPPPIGFKCCILDSVNFKKKLAQLAFEQWLLGLVDDGCNVNKKAA